MDTTITIGDQLRQAIEAANLSRYRISQQTGIPASALCRFCNGESGLSLDSIDKIGTLLNLTIRSKPDDEGTRHG
tara:strand:+ start:52 stop:276 length:225 start_codon:yes stop_codon:yes gene_type:complete